MQPTICPEFRVIRHATPAGAGSPDIVFRPIASVTILKVSAIASFLMMSKTFTYSPVAWTVARGRPSRPCPTVPTIRPGHPTMWSSLTGRMLQRAVFDQLQPMPGVQGAQTFVVLRDDGMRQPFDLALALQSHVPAPMTNRAIIRGTAKSRQ